MIIRAAIGVLSVLGVNSILKDNKDPKSKEEIKENIRKTSNTVSKYAQAIYEVASENLGNNTKDKSSNEGSEDYFKNIRKDD